MSHPGPRVRHTLVRASGDLARPGQPATVILNRRPRAADYMTDDDDDDNNGGSDGEEPDDSQAQKNDATHSGPAPLGGASRNQVIDRDNGYHGLTHDRAADQRAADIPAARGDDTDSATDNDHLPAANETHPSAQTGSASQLGDLKKAKNTGGSVDVDAFDEHTRHTALRMWCFKRIIEQQSAGSSRCNAPANDEEEADLRDQIQRELMMCAEDCLRSPYINEVKDESDGKITLQLNSSASSSDKGRLLYRPHKATMDDLRQIGYSRRSCIVAGKVGDYVIEMSGHNRDILFDMHDYLRARKAELRTEWLRKKVERANLLKGESYETIRDQPKRIPYADQGRAKIVAAKVIQASHEVTDLVENNRIQRDVIFIRGNPLDGKPGFASREDWTFINAVTGKPCPSGNTKHAIVLEETEELYAQLTYFITQNNFHEWDSRAVQAEEGANSDGGRQ